jgi:pyruvate dehydrogenase E1 component alpha subunit
MMLAVREVEQRIGRLFSEGLTSGTAHLCVGQEACAVGAVSAARPTDPIISSHRGHGHFLARTADPAALLGELMGKTTGPCMGRGGSQHLCSLRHRFYGTNGITGGGLPIATGLALSAKLRQTNDVVLCFFGDGAATQGTFHECLNMAAIWQLPVLFFCENNHYAMSTRAEDNMRVASIARHAEAYGMPATAVDGMDVEAVRRAVGEALDAVRSGGGPRLIEADCYRFSGHSKSDRFVYRTRQEEELWRQRDPLPASRRRLVEGGITEQAVQALEAEVRRAVAEAYDEAVNAPAPPPAQVLTSPYSEHVQE